MTTSALSHALYRARATLVATTGFMVTGKPEKVAYFAKILAELFRANVDNSDVYGSIAKAIAELARTPVPADVKAAYGGADMQFGADYILPKPFDRRLLPWVASRVARIACEEGTAQAPITDFDAFEAELEQQAQYLATAFKA